MQKRVLVVEQSVKQAHEIAKLIRAISMDILVIEVYDIEAAYQCAAERVIDVFVVGVIPCNRLEVQEYKFIENLRNIRRYMSMQRFISYADHPHLVQCARNTLINTRRIRNIDITNRFVTMTNGDVVDIGVSYVGRLKEYLEHKF